MRLAGLLDAPRGRAHRHRREQVAPEPGSVAAIKWLHVFAPGLAGAGLAQRDLNLALAHRATVAPERTLLRGVIEMDETWVGGAQAGVRGSRQLKGRRPPSSSWPSNAVAAGRDGLGWR